MPWNTQMVSFTTTWMEIQPHHRLTWMEIQPVGWKSNQQQNSEKLKVLDFGHATSIWGLESSKIYFGIIWLIWPCLKGKYL